MNQSEDLFKMAFETGVTTGYLKALSELLNWVENNEKNIGVLKLYTYIKDQLESHRSKT